MHASTGDPSEPEPAGGPVLVPLTLGRSAYQRLVLVARSEGLDPVTLATNAVVFQLGIESLSMTLRARQNGAQRAAERTIRPDLVQATCVCMLCGRARPASNPPKCPACGGAWTVSSA